MSREAQKPGPLGGARGLHQQRVRQLRGTLQPPGSQEDGGDLG